MNKKKIFNDPVYGFVNVPYGIIYDLIEHPYFQRLRRIKQVSLTHYVYPGALHTRFHHALGAMHLMQQALSVLKYKKVPITKDEQKGALIAILLHDIGHGPFSHTLEHTLVEVHHETLSVLFMEELNKEFGGKLQTGIDIFLNKHPKPFLHQLVSSQLDMDRMDYLTRDSFFTGVYEGVIGYDRIIKMLNVKDGNLVVEEKGIYSLEKFLMARRLMYWQVYLHKTVLVAEQMLVKLLLYAKETAIKGASHRVSDSLTFFLTHTIDKKALKKRKKDILFHFSRLDDHDVSCAVKTFSSSKDFILSFLADGLLNRRLFKIELKNSPFQGDYVEKIRLKVSKKYKLTKEEVKYLVFSGTESNHEYSTTKNEICILFKDGKVKPMSKSTDYGMPNRIITKYYLCYPKNL